MKVTDPNLSSLTDIELAQFYIATLNGSRGHIGDEFYWNLQFACEIDRRVLAMEAQQYGNA